MSKTGAILAIIFLNGYATTTLNSVSVKSSPVIVRKSLQSVVAPQGFINPLPEDVAFTWAPPTNTDLVVTGYNLYYGTESRFNSDGIWVNYYPNVIRLPNITNGVAAALAGATTYYFAVDATDQDGVEGELSEEVTYTTPLVMDVGFQFDQPVTNITLQWSPNLSQWNDLGTIPTNGVWRLTGDPAVARFYRGKATPSP